MARSRRRYDRRGMFLHASIVMLAAATTAVWVARPHIERADELLPRLTSPAIARLRPPQPSIGLLSHLSPPPLPRLHLRHSAATRAAPDTRTWLEQGEEPPSLAITAPTVVAPAVPAVPAAIETALPEAAASSAPDPGAGGGAATAPTPAVAPAIVSASVISTAYLRTSPSTAALITRSLPAGTTVTILGCSSACSWLLVQTQDGSQAWSSANWFSVQGSLTGLPQQ